MRAGARCALRRPGQLSAPARMFDDHLDPTTTSFTAAHQGEVIRLAAAPVSVGIEPGQLARFVDTRPTGSAAETATTASLQAPATCCASYGPTLVPGACAALPAIPCAAAASPATA